MQDLIDCANVLVGNEQEDVKGISGGQMRRLAVGIELVTHPKMIVLDEPTSGLDSEIALTIMHTLKALAKNNRTVQWLSIFCRKGTFRCFAVSINRIQKSLIRSMTFICWITDGRSMQDRGLRH